MKNQIRALDETLNVQKKEFYLLEQDDQENADWMWDVQCNYTKLEKEMVNLDAKRVELRTELINSEEKQKQASRHLQKEQNYINELQLNGVKS